jgi:hypothetical protein
MDPQNPGSFFPPSIVLIPDISTPIGIEIFVAFPAKAEIHHLRQVVQKVGSLGQNLLIGKIAKKRLAMPFWVMAAPQDYLPNIKISYAAWQAGCKVTSHKN